MGYELYGFVAEANGEAMPVAFLFTTSTGEPAEGAKTRMLCDILKYLNEHCPNIMFTLSDEEPADITICMKEISKAKHQLCYWHGIRYIEGRLVEDKPPAAYDPRRAHWVFDFINPTWAPGITAVYVDDNNEDGGGEEREEVAMPSMPVSNSSVKFATCTDPHRGPETITNLPATRIRN